jgi:hypothetical protein
MYALIRAKALSRAKVFPSLLKATLRASGLETRLERILVESVSAEHSPPTINTATNCGPLFFYSDIQPPGRCGMYGPPPDCKQNLWVGGIGLLECIRPVFGAMLLAIMESARRWSK